ncbi:MAG: cobalt ECF transporter T component CbiQ [Terriglobia bacterium]
MRKSSFVERTLASFGDALEHAFFAEETARAPGLLQRIDPRVKVFGMLSLVVAAACARNLWVLLGLLAAAVVIAALSGVTLGVLAKRIWAAVLVFTGFIALPAPFLVPGRIVGRLPLFGWTITAQGLASAAFLVARVEAAATLSFLLILCTPWDRLLKSLRVFRLPCVFVVILGMTYRYLFLLLRSARDMFESRRSRIVADLGGRERRRVAAASAGVLMSKTLDLSTDVYLAMQSRGFRGDVDTLDEFEMRRFDWAMLACFAALAAAAFWLGRFG